MINTQTTEYPIPSSACRIPALPVLPDEDSALIAYLCKLEADERIREFSEEF